MEATIVILILVLLVEWLFKPRIDQTSEGWWLLWYGKHTRYYVKLFKTNPPDNQ